MTKTTKKTKTETKKKAHAKKRPATTPHRRLPKHRLPQENRQPPRLRFTPHAWAKLVYLCHSGDTEIGCFGITPADDLLLIEDLFLPQQVATSVTVGFDDESVADFFEDQVTAGRSPEQFARVWIHTHPGNCPNPSSLDEETFARVFGGCDWAVMFILARGGETYARLSFKAGPGGSIEIPVEVDFGQPFAGSDHVRWQDEYRDRVHQQQAQPLTPGMRIPGMWDLDELPDPFAMFDDLDRYDEVELMSELGDNL